MRRTWGSNSVMSESNVLGLDHYVIFQVNAVIAFWAIWKNTKIVINEG